MRASSLVLLVLASCLLLNLGQGASVYYGVCRNRCLWKCAKTGNHVFCGPDEVMMGLCGSGSNSDCNNQSYCPDSSKNRVAVLCCNVKMLPKDAVC